MTGEDPVRRLRREIESRLAGLVDRDYVLMGLPYYLNIGDILIWEGTRQYLRTLPHRCLNPGYRYREEDRIGPDTLILLQGGGNFGDLWRRIQEERLGILRRHPGNPAVVLPVSCWYDDRELMRRDADELARHPDLTICARDQASYDRLAAHFRNRIRLVPDMAFFIDPGPLRKFNVPGAKDVLYLKRRDKELAADRAPPPPPPPGKLTVSDWPSKEHPPFHWGVYRFLLNGGRCARRWRGVWRAADFLVQTSDWFYHRVSRRRLIRQGAAFIGRHGAICTTRLHGAILAVLMGRKVQVVDNLDGKTSAFFKTWLEGADGVELIGCIEGCRKTGKTITDSPRGSAW
jgi:pyruvyl transferase EpsO